jgi:glycerol-3-phosphate O-acyltransferase / dihydroxyacetone phosphate acyltransferase
VLIYELLKPVMYVATRVFYRIQVAGEHNLPRNKPVIVAPNHPNAFMDAIVLAVHTRQQLHFLVRSDVFNTPLKRFFLGQLNQHPIYRIQEGADNLHKNEETFRLCNELLARNKTILIFPEGICIQERRLRKLKKGLARIVFGAEASMDYKMDLLVVPIGINYENPKKFRSKLLIEYGKPIHVSDYVKNYLSEPARTINDFTRDVEDSMAELLTIIPDKNIDRLVTDIEEVYKKDLIESKGLDPRNLQHDRAVTNEMAQAVDHFHKQRPERTERFGEKIDAYLKELKKRNLRDHLLKPSNIEKMSFGRSALEFIGLWFGMPLYVIGLINHYLPWVLGYRIANNTAKNVEFHSSVNVASGTFIALVWYAALTLTVALVFRNWYLLAAWMILIPVSGWFSIRFRSFMKKTLGKWRLLGLVRKDRSTVERLVHTRMDIIQELEEARDEYRSIKGQVKQSAAS